MKKTAIAILGMLLVAGFSGCSTYKAKPLSFQLPDAYGNAVDVAGARVASKAYVNPAEAREAFGFDVRAAGLLPVQLVFDHRGAEPVSINAAQTFLEDDKGNLWPILSSRTAYERAAKYSKTKEVFKEGAYAGFLGAAAGTVIGAAVGIVTGDNVLETAAKGAAVGAAGGATLGGAKGYGSNEARRTITEDLREKSLQNKPVAPNSIAHGFLFFPGEAESARQLRLQLVSEGSDETHVATIMLKNVE